MAFELNNGDSPVPNPQEQGTSLELEGTAEQAEQAELAPEQSQEDIDRLNDDARIEARKAREVFDQVNRKIDSLLTTIDLNSVRSGKIYKGTEGLHQALADARQIITSAETPMSGLVDAQNNLLDSTKQRMRILERDTSLALEHLQKAAMAKEAIVDVSKREGVEPTKLQEDLEAWQSTAREILSEIDVIEAEAQTAAAKHLAE